MSEERSTNELAVTAVLLIVLFITVLLIANLIGAIHVVG
jgi:hypothetical protein